jgi:tetratricopeptide (TPR) repeat protein
MANRRAKLAFGTVLLFLLFVRCALGTRAERTETARPHVVFSGEQKDEKVDVDRIKESVGEAQEAPEEYLRKLEARGAPNTVAPTAETTALPAEPQSVVGTEGRRSDDRGLRIQSSPSGASVSSGAAPTTPQPPPMAKAEPPPMEQRPRTESSMEAQKPPQVRLQEERRPLDASELSGDQAAAYHQSLAEKAAPRPAKKGKVGADEASAKSGEKQAPKKLLAPISQAPALGKIMVLDENGHYQALKPRAVRVIAYVEGPRARTIVDYVFENTFPKRIEGTFFYPLPADGSPAGFAMFDGAKSASQEAMFQSRALLPDLGKAMPDPSSIAELAPSGSKNTIDWGTRKDARVVEQHRAREVYEDLVRQGIDPGLMEWSGGNKFEARVFPLEPKSLKRVVVAIEQPLVYDGGRFRFHYTLPEDASIKQLEAVLFVDSAHGKIGEAPQGAEASKSGRWSRFDWRKATGGTNIELALESEPSVVLRGRDRAGLAGDAFYAEVRPDLSRGKETKTKRALILIDTSLSMEEYGSDARRTKLIEALLDKDDSIEKYAVALFDVRARWLHGIGWRDNTPANRTETIDELSRIYLEGATNFAALLRELERQRSWAVEGGPTTVFLFSDGEITWGMDRLDALLAHHPIMRELRWITYRFGEAPANQALFDMLSNESRGRTVTMLSEKEVDSAAIAHRASAVELASVTVRGAEAADIVVAGAPKLVFPGQTLRIAGRILGKGTPVLNVDLHSDGASSPIAVPLADAGADDPFAPRAWAELQTKKLIAMDDERLDRMVVALSQHYRLANARASFIVLDREEQAAQYKLKDEIVDVSNLETLRKREEDQRRDRLLGIALDDVPAEGRALVQLLKTKTDGLPPMLQPQPVLDRPDEGGEERIAAENAYRSARPAEKLDVLLYDRIARTRALSGDTFGALRALSSSVELRPKDTEAMRLVGYALLGLAQYEAATELFEHVRLQRPFEPEAFLEEAIALDAFGRYDLAARNYEIALSRTWHRHQNEVRTTAAYHYARMLTGVLHAAGSRFDDGERKLVSQRLAALSSQLGAPFDRTIDYQLTTLWSTDNIDIDLWVYEPNGEKCFYSHRDTSLGGHLFWDVTDGLGPELYHAVKAAPGSYDTLIHFYGNNSPKMSAPTSVLMIVDRDPLSAQGARNRRFLMRVLPKKDAVLMMRTETFAAR